MEDDEVELQLSANESALITCIRENVDKDFFDQELILKYIGLFTNRSFIKKIIDLQRKFNIPRAWRLQGTDDGQVYRERQIWFENKGKEAPRDWDDRRIVSLCRQFKFKDAYVISEHETFGYGTFIVDYLYFGSRVLEGLAFYSGLEGAECYRYKADIALLDEKLQPRVGYIKFYQDTTEQGLKDFIHKAQRDIQIIQEKLVPYPLSRTRKKVILRRDLLAYLLHLTGKNTREIAEELFARLSSETDSYDKVDPKLSDITTPTDSNIRKIISDIERDIRRLFED